MNKLIEITIAGVLLKVEEAAWEQLKRYNASLRTHFASQAGSKEIIEDISSRMAELFLQRSETKGYVSEKDVEEVIALLGKPFEMEDGPIHEERQQAQEPYVHPRRRLFRDPDNRMIGGVCGGVAAYFDIDPVWIRLAFAVSFFFAGTGVLLYIILWAVIPEAKTAADRLQMRGEKVTAENIGKFFEDEAQKVKKNFNEFGQSEEAYKWKARANRAGDGISNAARRAGHLIEKILAFFFATVALFFFIAFIMGYFGLFNRYSFLPFGPVVSAIYDNEWEHILVVLGITLMVSIPLLAIITKGIWILAGKGRLPGYLRSLYGYLWGVSWIILIVMGFRTAQLFAVTASSSDTRDIISNDTLVIKGLDNGEKRVRYRINYRGIHVQGDHLDNITPSISILKTNSTKTYMEIEREACGNTNAIALHNAELIPDGFRADGDTIQLLPFFSLDDKKVKWRKQELKLKMYIPVGKKVILEKNAINNIGRIDSDYDEDELEGQVLVMTEKGLVPASSLTL